MYNFFNKSPGHVQKSQVFVVRTKVRSIVAVSFVELMELSRYLAFINWRNNIAHRNKFQKTSGVCVCPYDYLRTDCWSTRKHTWRAFYWTGEYGWTDGYIYLMCQLDSTTSVIAYIRQYPDGSLAIFRFHRQMIDNVNFKISSYGGNTVRFVQLPPRVLSRLTKQTFSSTLPKKIILLDIAENQIKCKMFIDLM